MVVAASSACANLQADDAATLPKAVHFWVILDVSMYACIYVCMYVCMIMYVCIYVSMYVCMYVAAAYTYMYIYVRWPLQLQKHFNTWSGRRRHKKLSWLLAQAY